MASVAFPALAHDPRLTLAEIQKVKPDFIIQKPRELLNIVLRTESTKQKSGFSRRSHLDFPVGHI